MKTPQPLAVAPYFCPADVDPFDTVEWEQRTAQIKDENGNLIFEQTDCQIPKSWSPLATNVVVSKYFYGEPHTEEREKSVAQVIHRVARTIADWGIEDGYFASRDDGENFYRELAWLCLHQHGAFNSPVWFNVGLYHQYGVKGSQGNYHWDTKNNAIHRPETPYEYPQASACFIQSVEDNMEDIMRLATSEAMLFKFGSGTGTDLSTIRSAREKLSGGGVPSGPLSFMRVYDQIAAVVKCVTADTYIYTADGIRRIGDVVGDAPEGFSPAERLTVVTPDGPMEASQIYVGQKSPIRRMTLRHTGLELSGTLEHPVMVLTPDFRLLWKTLRDVTPGDRVAVDRTHSVWSRRVPDLREYHPEIGRGRGESPKRTITLPERMTPELARLLGYLAAEGTVDEQRIRFCNADLDVFEDFIQCFERTFGTRIKHGISTRTNPKTGVVTHVFCASWHYAARFLLALGAGGKSADKQIPQTVLDSPKALVTEFLRGYFEGDGHVGRNIYASTRSRELARQLQIVLLNFGIVSQKRERSVGGRPNWRILLCGRSAERFIDEIGFVSQRKRDVDVPRGRDTNFDVVPHLVDHLRSKLHGRGYYHTESGELRRTQFEGLFSRAGNISYENLTERLENLQIGLAELDPEGLETLVYVLNKQFLWDEVRTMEDAGEAVTYDLTVPGVHAFSTNGIVSHNSGGKTRRAAKMQSLKDWHPDILEFIQAKGKEERKARTLIESGEYEANFNGEAYSSIMFQNANLSVRVSDEFMQAVVDDKKWTTHHVTSPQEKGPEYEAPFLLKEMAQGTWYCGDPGVQYETTINKWHTCKNSGPINASNPCVTGDTLVATEDGLRRIEDIVNETPEIVGRDGRLHETTQVIEKGIKPVYRLRTESGFELKLTADHRVLTKRGDVPAENLTEEDEIIIGQAFFGHENLFDAQERGRHLAVELGQSANSVATSVDTAELLGLKSEPALQFIGGFVLGQTGFQSWKQLVIHDFHKWHFVFRSSSQELLQLFKVWLHAVGVRTVLQYVNDEWLLDVDGACRQTCYDVLDHALAGSIIDPFNYVDNKHLEFVDKLGTPLEYLGEEPVYDLTVRTDDPNLQYFVANGVVVHNCSEYMFLDDTACNLASINLKKCMNEDGTFNVDRFRRACAIFITAQEILVDHASYPTPAIAENSHRFRPLGLGYANLGSLLMSMGIPYDSDQGRGICGALTALLNGQGYLTSSEIASHMGPFKGFEENRDPMLDVMRMHQAAVEQIDPSCPGYLKDAARQVWADCVASGEAFGYRNAQATVLAPTGTIAFMMDCDTTGIEPDIALVKYKQLAGGGMMKIVNRTVPKALEKLNYDQITIGKILKFIEDHDTIEGAPGFKEEHLPVFDCAFKPRNGTRTIPWKAHITMMAAAQPFLSGAISKTVNMPEHSTVEDIEEAYLEGWRLGLKALAIYRDGSKQSQPLATTKEGDRKKAQEPVVDYESARKLVRRRLPATRQSLTHKFSVGGHEGYTTVGLFEDGTPGELFITMAKEGSTIGGLMDVIGTLTSMALQYGVPLEVIVNKFAHMRFEPSGWTSNPDIPNAKSVVDYIFRWLGIQFLPGYREANTPNRNISAADVPDTPEAVRKHVESFIERQLNGSANGHANGSAAASSSQEAAQPQASQETAVAEPADSPSVRSEQFARFQSDAPACDNCGAITVRNGNCYLCHNCGNSMGCS